MAELDPTIAADVVAACQAGAGEINGGLARTFDAEIEAATGEPTTFDPAALAAGFDGPGLLVVLKVGTAAAVVAFPEAGGLLPGWYQAPDPTGSSRLTTLAQELGMLVLPETFMPDDFQAAGVPHLGEALARGGVTAGAGLVPLNMKSGDKLAAAAIVWPAASPEKLLADEAPAEAPAATAAAEPPPPPAPAKPAAVKPQSTGVSAAQSPAAGITYERLPNYSRSLLRIRVPVTVTLASKRQPIGAIIDLGPGAIIQFDKSCEELLDLELGDHVIAKGEAVKVGDKFGIRLMTVVLPEERFRPVRRVG